MATGIGTHTLHHPLENSTVVGVVLFLRESRYIHYESYCKVPLFGGKLVQSTAFECHGVNVRAITAPLTITREVALIIGCVCEGLQRPTLTLGVEPY